LTEQVLSDWHRMVLSGRSDIDVVGRYREHEDAMQVVSGALHKPTVHFEAPPSREMSNGNGAVPRLVRGHAARAAIRRFLASPDRVLLTSTS
jgi:hypothetical protein